MIGPNVIEPRLSPDPFKAQPWISSKTTSTEANRLVGSRCRHAPSWSWRRSINRSIRSIERGIITLIYTLTLNNLNLRYTIPISKTYIIWCFRWEQLPFRHLHNFGMAAGNPIREPILTPDDNPSATSPGYTPSAPTTYQLFPYARGTRSGL
jgi:hypothetical protein